MDPSVNVNQAQIVSAFNSIQKNGSQYATLTFYIAVLMAVTIIVIFVSLVVLQIRDQAMAKNDAVALLAVAIAATILLLFTYFAYLRNIGQYVYSRIRPVAIDRNVCQEYKDSIGIPSSSFV